MQTEIEAKSLNIDKDQIRQKLKSLGAKIVFEERKFTRVTFDTPEMRSKNMWIRLRDEGDKVSLTLKQVNKDGGIYANKEISFTVDDFDAVIQFITTLGIQRKGFQENLREEWDLDGVVFDIDTWPNIEPWLEIEADSEDKVKEYFEKLGLDYAKAMFGSSDMVYKVVKGIDILAMEELKFS